MLVILGFMPSGRYFCPFRLCNCASRCARHLSSRSWSRASRLRYGARAPR
jgi:hypothetical protein